jgi:multisubunit Na+/H+ antiporter MnhC subunit
MKILFVFLALMAMIGGLYMLISNETDSWMFGIPLLAAGLTYFWYQSGFRGLNSK